MMNNRVAKKLKHIASRLKNKVFRNRLKNVKIDLVYLWGDMSDENFRIKKENLAKTMHVRYEANNKCRFTDNDELKYSLRSVEKYAPWINHIYIVTNNQCPKWLNTKHPKITLINQEDIMPEGSNPCFNSNAIEHCIVNIPGLNEYFLYANDDNLIFDHVKPEFFYNKKTGYPICRYEGRFDDNSGLYFKMLKNSANLISQKYGKYYNMYPHHNMEAYRKSEILACQKIFEKEITHTVFTPFRTETDVQKSIYNNYVCAVKHGHFKIVSKIDSNLPWYRKAVNSFLKIYAKDSVFVIADQKNITDEIIKYKPKLFCINDAEWLKDNHRKYIKTFLECFFPNKSKFEKA